MIVNNTTPQYQPDGTIWSWIVNISIPELGGMTVERLMIQKPPYRPRDQWTPEEIAAIEQEAMVFPTNEPIFIGEQTPQDPPIDNPA